MRNEISRVSTLRAYRIGVNYDSLADIAEITASYRSICCRHAFTSINTNNCQLFTRVNNFTIICSVIRKIVPFKNIAIGKQFQDCGINSCRTVIKCEAILHDV